MRKQNFLLLLWGACVSSSLLAEEKTSGTRDAYDYRHTIEYTVGNVQNLKSYPRLPDQGIALLCHDAEDADLSLRYSCFFTRHWGAYAQLDAFFLEGYDRYMLEPLSQHYNQGSKEVRITYNFDDDCGISSSHGMYLFGAVYRYDVGRWSFRPRLGVGKIHQHSHSTLFYVVDTSTEYDYEEYTLSTTDRDGKRASRFNAFAYAPALQITFTSPRRRFFLSAELQWTGTIGHFYQNTKVNQWRATEPQDWQPQNDGYYYINSTSDFVKKVEEHRERVQMGNFLQFRFGMGWNIGRRRIAKLF